MKAGVSTLGTHSLLSFMRYIEDFCREFRSIAAEQDEVCVVSSIEPIHHFANFFWFIADIAVICAAAQLALACEQTCSRLHWL